MTKPKIPGADRRNVWTITAALYVVTSSVNLQAPLYKVYAEAAGGGQGIVALTFSLYVAVLVLVLIALGGVADRIGTKTTTSLGLCFALAAHAAVMTSPILSTMLFARALQGVSVALTVGAATSHIATLLNSPPQAARLSGSAVTAGLGTGALLTSLALRYWPSLVPVSYHVVALATLLCLLLVLPLENHRDRGARVMRLPMISARTAPYAQALFLSWSLTGVIIATLPARLASTGAGQWSGLVLFMAIVPGILVQVVSTEPDPARFLQIGSALLIVSTGLFALGIQQQSTLVICAASVASALTSFGFTYAGGLTAVLQCTDGERVRLVSGFYLLGYVGLGVPCIAVGFLSERVGLAAALLYVGAALAGGLLAVHTTGAWRAGRRASR